jgi:hypothetical protein
MIPDEKYETEILFWKDFLIREKGYKCKWTW